MEYLKVTNVKMVFTRKFSDKNWSNQVIFKSLKDTKNIKKCLLYSAKRKKKKRKNKNYSKHVPASTNYYNV